MTTPSDGIIETIDGALRDYELSNDAMRWVPEHDRTSRPKPLPVVVVAIDPSPAALEITRR